MIVVRMDVTGFWERYQYVMVFSRKVTLLSKEKRIPFVKELATLTRAGRADNPFGGGAGPNCRKQICNQNDPDGNPGDGVDILEIWEVMQRCVVPLKYVFQEIQNTPALCVKVSYLKYQYVVVQVTILPVAVVTEIALVAITIEDKVGTSPNPTAERNRWCSCSCYSVNLHSIAIDAEQGIFCSEILDNSSSCYSTNLLAVLL